MILITGGTGFIGKHLFQKMGSDENATWLSRHTNKHFVQGLFTDANFLRDLFSKHEIRTVLHMAGVTHHRSPEVHSAINDRGTKTLVNEAHKAGVANILFLGTAAIHSKSSGPYADSKRAAEEHIRHSGLNYTILRPSLVYGPGDSRNLAPLIARIRKGGIMPLPGKGEALTQPLFMDDLIDVIEKTLHQNRFRNEEFDLAGPEPLSLAQLVSCIARETGQSPRTLPLPIPVFKILLHMHQWFSRDEMVSREQIQRVDEDKTCDIEPARHQLDFHPRPFPEGIRYTLKTVLDENIDNTGIR